jgi:siroheme synthase (precorrin-2 oxidase/ferrochelatase)
MKILAYASDSPESSDISYLSLIDIKKTIKVAISTGGSSPIMAKKIKLKTEICLQKNISNQDIQLIKIQKFARSESQKFITTQAERKKFLYALMNDKRVKELLKDKKYKAIQTVIKKMVKDWK